MQDLTEQFWGNYRGHAGFGFAAESWDIAEIVLAEFNQTYASVRQMRGVLDGLTIAGMQRNCRTAMAEIVALMSKQCVDDFEIRFLQELQSACARLLHEDIAWYAKPTRSHFVELGGERERQDAMLMQVERHYFGRTNCLNAVRGPAGSGVMRPIGRASEQIDQILASQSVANHASIAFDSSSCGTSVMIFGLISTAC